MYTEGFDELSEAENRPSRTYVSTGGQDSLKLQRENERLRKSLEKEQFFNRLLDQELKDLKISLQTGIDNQQQYNNRPRGVSRASFNVLLVITLLLAGFTAYTLLNDKKTDSRLPAGNVPGTAATTPAPITDSVPTIIAGKKSLPSFAGKQNTVAPPKAPIVERSASNADKQTVKSASVPASTKEVKSKTTTAAPVQQPAAAANNQTQPEETTATTTAAATTPSPTPAPTQPVVTPPVERAVVGKYMVSSKANFYSAPDENTLRSYFISPGSDKVVNALEDKNGFIYVEFKNDVGYITKGWLSKADLSKQ